MMEEEAESGRKRPTVQSVAVDLDRPGYIRIEAVLSVYPISRAAWYQGIKDGIYPKAVQLSRRSVGWPTSAIKALIENPPFSKVR
ncbi:MAG: AlpA family phage regulatory protein [Burkholderiales bacterium]|nr:AlpA family phage regulatory protein [Burkholderiales bacterium]